MRKIFADAVQTIAKKDKNIVFLTGDLGFNAFENLQKTLKNRFINAGIAEHNMATLSAGLAYAGLKPWIYSIAPFVTIKVLEEIRNDICFNNANVKIVGLGGGFDYGTAGPTHHALQDVAAILSLPNIKVYAPGFQEDVELIVKKTYEKHEPAYIRLTKAYVSEVSIPAYAPCRNIIKGNNITVIALGSILHKAIEVIQHSSFSNTIDLWLVTELPFSLPEPFIHSTRQTNNVCVIEEHVENGGLGQYISKSLLEQSVPVKKFTHLFAKGYISKTYGDRDFYLKENGLDTEGIGATLKKLL